MSLRLGAVVRRSVKVGAPKTWLGEYGRLVECRPYLSGKRKYSSFGEARAFVHSLNLKNEGECP
jgi:hypothetical protein